MDRFILKRVKRLYPTVFAAGIIALPLAFAGAIAGGWQSVALYFLMLLSCVVFGWPLGAGALAASAMAAAFVYVPQYWRQRSARTA